LTIEKSLLRQKSRDNWLTLGEKSAKILMLGSSQGKLGTISLILLLLMAPRCLTLNRLKTLHPSPTILYSIKAHTGLFSASTWLVRPVSDAEVQMAIVQCGPGKSGPDGFNAAFYQRNRATIGKEILLLSNSFFSHEN